MSELRIIDKTPIVWTDSGADKVITIASLAGTNAARKGAGNDFGATRPEWWELWAKIGFGSAPTVGGLVHFYWARSVDGTDYPAGFNSSDEAVSIIGAGTVQDRCDSCEYVGHFLAQNSTTEYWQFIGLIRMTTRYGAPLVLNSSGQSLSATGGNNLIHLRPHVPTDATP
jgi:hypothetical protein